MSTTSKSSQWYSGFDPRFIPGCSLWLDANDSSTITKGGSNITSWRDKSANGNNATNGSGTGPTTVTSGNLTYLSFDGSSNFLQSNATVVANLHTIITVFKPTLGPIPYNVLRFQPSNAPTPYIAVPYDAKAYASSYAGTSLDTTNSPLTVSLSGTQHNIVSTRITSGTQNVYKYGSLVSSGTVTISDSSVSSPLTIGRRPFSVAEYYVGQLAEIIIYNRYLTDTERQQVEGYLGWKWGLQSNLGLTTPLNVPNCVCWYDASDSSTITLSGSSVTAWNDKSTSANNLAPPATAARPTYTATQNGKNVVSFSGTQYLAMGTMTNMPTTTGAFSVFVVGRSTINTPSQYFFRFGDNDGITGGSFELYINNGNNGLYQDYYNTTASSTTTNVINSYFIFSQTATTSATSPFLNGTAFTTITNYSYTLARARGVVGARSFGGGPGFSAISGLIGTIGEIIVYDRQLTSTERQSIESYLSSKWNISTATSALQPYLSRPPFLTGFSPTDFSNCGLWLDALDVKTITGTTNVTQWNDKSGNGRNVTATNGPSYSSSTIVFPGINNRYLENTAWNSFSRINHTFIAVHKPDTNTAYVGNTRLISIQQTAGSPYVVFPYLNNTTPNGYINDGSASTNPAASGKTLLDNSSTSNYNIITAAISGSAQSIYNNGTLQDSRTFTIANGTITTGVKIGGQYAENYKGSVKEIIIYTRVLTAIEIQIIEGYLAWKWGYQTLLPSTHPFKNVYPLKVS